MVEKQYVSWNQVYEYISELYKQCYMNKFSPKGVYGIPRGGLVLATMISYIFKIPMLAAPCDGCLIVDDIADTGNSLSHYTENDTQFNKYFLTTFFYDKRSKVEPDFWLNMKQDKWIVFPWEEIIKE